MSKGATMFGDLRNGTVIMLRVVMKEEKVFNVCGGRQFHDSVDTTVAPAFV